LIDFTKGHSGPMPVATRAGISTLWWTARGRDERHRYGVPPDEVWDSAVA